MAATEFENVSRNVLFSQMVYHCNPHDRGKCNIDVVSSLVMCSAANRRFGLRQSFWSAV